MANNYYYSNPMFQTTPSAQPQQFFPQPQGNAYLINNSLEVANVPMSGGVSVALCMSENIMYLKTMQNGNPMFMAYKIFPYDNKEQNNIDNNEIFIKQLNDFSDRLKDIEKKISNLIKNNGGNLNELI